MEHCGDYIGVSPANDVSLGKRASFIESVIARVRDSKKTHLFGLTQFEVLKKYPLCSADSISWLNTVRFGTFKELDKLKSSEKRKSNDSRCALSDEYRLSKGIRYYKDVEQELTELWIRRGIVWNDN